MSLPSEMDAAPGSSPAIVEHFSIEGLHGYRTVSLTSRYAATVLIAKNGAGKTTLLGALDAFLRGQFLRLANLHFDRIRCQLRGVDEELILYSRDVRAMLDVPEGSEAYVFARRYGIDLQSLLEFVLLEWPSGRNTPEIHDNDVFKLVTQKHGYSTPDTNKVFDRLLDSLRIRNPTLERVHDAVKRAVGEAEIVYLPTYRRIELPLSDADSDKHAGHHRQRPSIQSRLGLSRRGLFNPNIQFGLSDIAERLSRLNNEIVVTTNQGYGEISANIITELLDGTFESTQPTSAEIPDRDSLALFFERVRAGRRYPYHFGYREIAFPNLDQIYDESGVSRGSKQFLLYFLEKLNTVIKSTRTTEKRVEDFIFHCNNYLSGNEPTTALNSPGISGDDKKLELDRKTLSVSVKSTAVDRVIPMDSLSSGEKQMISLFARLYLYTGPKIVLIDEPELSLSIDWQRKILMDVLTAPTCAQVIAITHSPFVFDNALEPYAKSLDVRVDWDATTRAIELEGEVGE